MSRSAFIKLITCATLQYFSSAYGKEASFDVKTLESLGYTNDVADFFSEGTRFLPGKTHVTLVVNATDTYQGEVTFSPDGILCADAALLTLLKLKKVTLAAECNDLSALWPGTHVTLDPGQFRVQLALPESAFDPELASGSYQSGGHAILMNYSVFGQKISNKSNDLQSYQGMLEPGINIKNWVIRNHSTFYGDMDSSQYSLQETYALRSIESLKSVVQLGQFGLGGSVFGGMPLNGVQLYSDNAQTSIAKLFVPIEGVANTNAVVEIRQRGRIIYRTVVAPGPFSLTNLSQFSAGVPLDVDIIEEDGNHQKFTVANALGTLAHQEASSYQLGFGRYRNADESAKAAPLVGTGEYTFNSALAHSVTVASLLALGYQNLVLKNSQSSDLFGGLSTGISYGHNTAQGTQGIQLDGQLQKSLGGNFSGSLSTQYRTQNYFSADEALSRSVQRNNSGNPTLRNTTSAALTWAHPRWGAFSYSVAQNQYYNNDKSELVHMLSSNQQFGRNNFNLSLQKSPNNKLSAYASLSLPLGKGTLSNRVQKNGNTSTFGSTYQGSWGENRSYSAGVTRSGQSQRLSATSNTSNAYAQMAAGISQSTDNSRSLSLSASGSVAYANRTLASSAQQIGDTFAFVNIKDQPNLRIQSSGGGTVQTNRSGNAILPSLSPYTNASMQVDTDSLPLNIHLDSTTADFALARGSVAMKKIGAAEMKQLLLTVRSPEGVLLPVGASILDKSGKFMGTVVGDGNIMLTNSDIGKAIRIKPTNQNECQVNYQSPERFDANSPYETADAVCA